MKKSEVQVGKVYIVKVSGKLARVRLTEASPYGGWIGTNLSTNREVRIKSAAKLRGEDVPLEVGSRRWKLLQAAKAKRDANRRPWSSPETPPDQAARREEWKEALAKEAERETSENS